MGKPTICWQYSEKCSCTPDGCFQRGSNFSHYIHILSYCTIEYENNMEISQLCIQLCALPSPFDLINISILFWTVISWKFKWHHHPSQEKRTRVFLVQDGAEMRNTQISVSEIQSCGSHQENDEDKWSPLVTLPKFVSSNVKLVRFEGYQVLIFASFDTSVHLLSGLVISC